MDGLWRDTDQDVLVNQPLQHKESDSVRVGGYRVSSTLANILFAVIAITGQVGQNISLPLWIGSTNTGNSTGPHVDGYFVYSFASLSFVVIFGCGLLLILLVSPQSIGRTERHFPQLQFFLIGMFDATNGVLVVFAASEDRTAPYLQAVLGNFMIPLTVLIRFLILRKVPSLTRFLSAMVVLLMLFVCLIPQIFSLGSYAKDSGGAQSGPGKFLWPLCFMIGFIPAAFMNVLEERGLKAESESKQRVNLIYFLFWTSLYQFLVAVFFFWADIVPGFGSVTNIKDFWANWSFGVKCFFGGAHCTSTSGTRGASFILMYVISYLGSGLLMRHAEGATYLAVVSSLVTPLGVIFWTLFKPKPDFHWEPEANLSTWLSLAAVFVMTISIFVYNLGAPEKTREKEEITVDA